MIYDDINDEYIEIIPTYGLDDGLVTTFGVAKDIKREMKNYTFLIEIFKLITKKSFSDKFKVKHIDELLVKAGITVLNDKIYKRFLNDIDKNESINLFDLMHNISLLKYESSEKRGNILFCSPDIELPNKLILLKPIPLTEYGSEPAVRKILEISSGDVSFLCDGEFIFGIGKRNVMQNSSKKHLALWSIKMFGVLLI
ncbi:hypothetical protein OCE40_15010 [Bacillus toyonensis]|uniref:hypothetical protein n=1 Tax=Bacillus toyonensis TaxID=155322 RepID=UPI00103E68CB|nr:hypothetical protein [Bacillus toyonensis]MCU5303195.1 hypothetical protein [Bacillus toyonensis]TBX46488.1 hypothetical protein E0M44_16355 [Bacillus toyonensis]